MITIKNTAHWKSWCQSSMQYGARKKHNVTVQQHLMKKRCSGRWPFAHMCYLMHSSSIHIATSTLLKHEYLIKLSIQCQPHAKWINDSCTSKQFQKELFGVSRQRLSAFKQVSMGPAQTAAASEGGKLDHSCSARSCTLLNEPQHSQGTRCEMLHARTHAYQVLT